MPSQHPDLARQNRAKMAQSATFPTLANEGQAAISYTVTPNDYRGRTQTVTVKASGATTISWPADQYGYYDVVITAGTSDGFRRRYAGRIA
jgi:phospholipase C